jgi:uncharacterized membrane protein (UPF0127 family)
VLQAAIIIVVTGLLLTWWRDDTIPIQIGTVTIQAEVAHTEAERTVGLSGRAHIADNHGMLFVFENDGRWRIWMRQMKVPIDIIWLDADKKVVAVEHAVSPATYPNQFAPSADARFVLELASGAAAKAHIEPGVKAQFAVPSVAK